MHHTDRHRWNERYRERHPADFGLEPSDWLRIHENLLRNQPRGAAADLACGNGRNALYLARLGFDVEAMDIADVAIDWLTTQVEEEGLSVFPRMADLTTSTLPDHRYQVIVNFNFLERRLFPLIETALAPGGLVFFETFTIDQIDVLGGGMPREYVLQPNELLHAFPNLHVLHYREGIFSEFAKDRERAVASVVARKR